MAERVRVRDITNHEGNRLLRIVRHSSGSVVTWRRAQMALLSAQGMDVPAMRVAGHPLSPWPSGARSNRLRCRIPVDHNVPFLTWSLVKLADFLVAEGWSTTSATRACGSCSARGARSFK